MYGPGDLIEGTFDAEDAHNAQLIASGAIQVLDAPKPKAPATAPAKKPAKRSRKRTSRAKSAPEPEKQPEPSDPPAEPEEGAESGGEASTPSIGEDV